jgi:hypothetical protein
MKQLRAERPILLRNGFTGMDHENESGRESCQRRPPEAKASHSHMSLNCTVIPRTS